MVIVTVGIDLAKNVFAADGGDETGKPALAREGLQAHARAAEMRLHSPA